MNKDMLKKSVMSRISDGEVVMRPRWHFLLLSALLSIGSLILLFSLVYSVSLLMFFLRESGAWFTPSFGARGWMSLLASLPWLLIVLLGVFVVVLEILVRRYSFVYKKPLLTSVLVILGIVLLGGFAVSQTPLHRQMALFARGGALPQPVRDLYRPPFNLHSEDVHRGTIVGVSTSSLSVRSRDGQISIILIDRKTRFPIGTDFEVGAAVVIIGDIVATGTIRAFGIREVEIIEYDRF